MRGGGRQESGQEVRLHGLARPGPRGSGPTRTLGFPRGNVGLCLVRSSRKSCLAARLHHLTCPKDDMASVEWSRGRLGWRRLSVAIARNAAICLSLGVRKGWLTEQGHTPIADVGAFGPGEWCLSASASCKRSLVMEHLPMTGLHAAPQSGAIRSPSAVLGDVLQHHEALGNQPAVHVLHKDRFAVRIRIFGDTRSRALVADLAP